MQKNKSLMLLAIQIILQKDQCLKIIGKISKKTFYQCKNVKKIKPEEKLFLVRNVR